MNSIISSRSAVGARAGPRRARRRPPGHGRRARRRRRGEDETARHGRAPSGAGGAPVAPGRGAQLYGPGRRGRRQRRSARVLGLAGPRAVGQVLRPGARPVRAAAQPPSAGCAGPRAAGWANAPRRVRRARRQMGRFDGRARVGRPAPGPAPVPRAPTRPPGSAGAAGGWALLRPRGLRRRRPGRGPLPYACAVRRGGATVRRVGGVAGSRMGQCPPGSLGSPADRRRLRPRGPVVPDLRRWAVAVRLPWPGGWGGAAPLPWRVGLWAGGQAGSAGSGDADGRAGRCPLGAAPPAGGPDA